MKRISETARMMLASVVIVSHPSAFDRGRGDGSWAALGRVVGGRVERGMVMGRGWVVVGWCVCVWEDVDDVVVG